MKYGVIITGGPLHAQVALAQAAEAAGWDGVFTWDGIHLGDALIALESLYRYLRKFHALGDRRYVLLSLSQVVPLLVVLLSLEFMPRRRRLTG